uniref:Uncharacterized protein n=1 Tax=Setaria digitata TaxID=48799 RepID=A0A915Q5Y9_9BILA
MLSTQWSWDSARLIALVLNALYGLEEYYNGYHKDLGVDGVFGLRIIEGHLKSINEAVQGHDIDPEIMNEMRNLTFMAGIIANNALPFVANRHKEYFKQFQYLLSHSYEMNFASQRTDERLRWKAKQLKTGKSARISRPPPPLLPPVQNGGRCFNELFSTDHGLMLKNYSCHLSNDCIKQMVNQRGLTEYHLTHQVLYVAIALQTSCNLPLSNFIAVTNNQTITSFIRECCTNMIDEVNILLRNPKIMARLDYGERDLLMEQSTNFLNIIMLYGVFACGQFGFVELSSLHLLSSILSWQNPTLGCFMNDKANNDDITTAYDAVRLDSDLCSEHSSTVAAGALLVFLRFLLDRGPWPEYYLADQAVLVYNIAAEDKFRQFRYGRWVRDSLISSMRHVRPPEIGWSPDFLAYFLLLCIMLGGLIVIHFCYKPKSFYKMLAR